MVKTDGQNMTINDFIEQITPLELKKFECREPIKRLTNKDGGGPSQLDQTSQMLATIDNKSTGGKSMRRADSKATIRTSTTKSPLKKRGGAK